MLIWVIQLGVIKQENIYTQETEYSITATLLSLSAYSRTNWCRVVIKGMISHNKSMIWKSLFSLIISHTLATKQKVFQSSTDSHVDNKNTFTFNVRDWNMNMGPVSGT